MRKQFGLLLFMILLCFFFSLQVEARSYVYSDELQAVKALVEELIAVLIPMEGVVQEVHNQYIVLNVGRQEGVREGQMFEIYQADTESYLGLVEIVSVRSRNSDATFIEKRADVASGDLAEEVKGGRVAVSSFLDSQRLETRLSRSLQELSIYNLGRQPGYDVVERIDLDRILQELHLSYTGLLDESSSRKAGQLLGADFIVMGSIQERFDELLITARLNHIETGMTLATAMVVLSKTSSIMEQLRVIEPVLITKEDQSSIEIFPSGPLFLFPGEEEKLQAIVRDKDGFIDERTQVIWALSQPNIRLSTTQGDEVTILAIEPGTVQIRASTPSLFKIVEVTVGESRYLNQLILHPQETQILIGDSQTFQVYGKDQYGDEMPLVGVEWRILAGPGQLSNTTGEKTTLTGLREGLVQLQVSANGITATARVECIPPPPEMTSLQAQPRGVIPLNEGESMTLSAIPMDQYGQKMEIPVHWSLGNNRGQLSAMVGEKVTFTALSSGLALVQAEASGFRVEFEIEITYSVSGQVRGPDGRGLKGVTISFREGYSSVTTDSHGRFQKSGLEGEVVVTPSYEDYIFVPRSQRVSKNESQVNFATAPSKLTSLQVEPEGVQNLIEGESMTLSAIPMDQYGQKMEIPLHWSLGNDRGQLSAMVGEKVTFTALSSGLALVQAEASGFRVEFEIEITYNVSGQVRGSDGRGLKGVTILFHEDRDPVITDAQGRWQVSGLKEEILVTPILEEYTFEPSSQRIRGMNLAVDFSATPLPPRLVKLYIEPQKVDIFLEEVLELRARGFDQYGEEYLVSPVWNLPSSQGRLSNQEGAVTLFQANQVGLVEVVATEGQLSTTGVITVSYAPPVLTHLHIESSRTQMKTEEEETLKVVARDQYQREMMVEASWQVSSGSGHLSQQRGISTNFYSKDPGRTEIRATVGDISATMTLQVDARIPTRISVSPTDVTLAYGRTQTIEVIVFDQDGDMMAPQLSFDLKQGSAHVEVDGMQVYLTPTGFSRGELVIGVLDLIQEVTYSVYGFSLGAMLNQWIIMEDVGADLYTGTLAFRYGNFELEGSFGYGEANLKDSTHQDISTSPLGLTQAEGGLRFYFSRSNFEPFIRGRMLFTSGSWEAYQLVGPGGKERIDLTGDIQGSTIGFDLGVRLRLGRRLSLLLFGGYELGSNTIIESTTDGLGKKVFLLEWKEDLGTALYGTLIRFMF